MTKLAVATLAAGALLGATSVSADLPIHCIRPQVLGKWTFHLGAPTGKHRTTCGHSVPDTEQNQPTLQSQVVNTLSVDLLDPAKNGGVSK